MEIGQEEDRRLPEQFDDGMLSEWLRPCGDDDENMSEDDGYNEEDIESDEEAEDDDTNSDEVSMEEALEEFHDSMLKEWQYPPSEDEAEESDDGGFDEDEEEDDIKVKLEKEIKEVKEESAEKDKSIEELRVKLKDLTFQAEIEYRKRLKAEAEVIKAQNIIEGLLKAQDFIKTPTKVKEKKGAVVGDPRRNMNMLKKQQIQKQIKPPRIRLMNQKETGQQKQKTLLAQQMMTTQPMMMLAPVGGRLNQ